MDKKIFYIDGNNLTIDKSIHIVYSNSKIALSKKALGQILKSRKLVEKWIDKDEVVYGITTGFGEFKDVKISKEDTELLQRNLILSHSAGVGKYIPDLVVRLMLLFRINSLAKGYSGVRLELMNFLVSLFNSEIIPLIPSQGSVGSSGDLAPLSHLALSIIGKGYCKYKGDIIETEKALKKVKLKPLKLAAKEGLALTNGTQMMSAYLCKTLSDAIYLSKISDICGAFSVESLKCTSKAFDNSLQLVRPHKGQIDTAYNLRKLLENSQIMKSHLHCNKVQDSYSTRCMPQVHGAVKDTINHCKKVLEIEINSATDNPLIFPDENVHIEGGNFHGEPLALIGDFLAIAISEIGNISERRTSRLVDGSLSGLPRFLTDKGGINSGFMISQYTAAALVSENKVLSHPASVDSIPTSANQEDHNSMGSISARKAFEVLNNVKKILAIEILCASQGLDFHKPLKPGKGVNAGYNYIRKYISPMSFDRLVSEDIIKMMNVLFGKKFIDIVEKSSGKLKI